MTFRAPLIRYTWPQDDYVYWRTWTWSYNLNLIAQDRFPPGEQFYDRPPIGPLRPADYPEPATRTWTWQYNPNLIAKDQMIVGKQVTDLPPRDYQRPQDLRTWIWNYNLNLIGQDRMVVGEQITDLPPRAYPEPATRTWVWNYNVNLIGKDKLPVGEQLTDLPPRAYPEPATRTWIGVTVPPVTIVIPFNQDDWPTPRAYAEPATRTWAWSYNINLIAQDVLPTGEQVSDLPPRAYSEPATRTWISFYNLNLIGKDRLPTGEISTDLPPRAYPEPATRTWTWQYNVNLIAKDAMAVGEQVTDLPPRAYPEPATRTWVWNYNLNLVGQDKLPVGEAIYDLPPRDYAQPAKTWTWNYNLNLIAQDRLPSGKAFTDLPPRDHSRILQTWIASLNLPLITVVQPLPFNQYTWPTPQPLTQPDRGFTAFYNPNLIGQDRFPPGARLSDLPPRDHVRLLQSWVQAVNLALTVPPSVLPVGAIVTDLPPRAYPEPATRTWTFGYTSLPPVTAASVGVPAADWQAISLPWDGQTWIQNPQTLRTPGLPPGEQVYDLSPRGYPEPATRTWTFSYSLELIGQDRLPFRQQDWPLPTIAAQPDRGFSASYNLNLIGLDRLPVGTIITALPPPGYIQPITIFISGFSNTLASLALAPLPPGTTFDLRLPLGHLLLLQPDRGSTSSPGINLIPPPPTVVGDYTVSGLGVHDRFPTTDGVVYTQPGHPQLITKRTN